MPITPRNNYEVSRIFIASPGDLKDERARFRAVIEKVNAVKAYRDGKHLEAVGWEDTLPGRGRPQALINEDLLTCDLVLFLVWKRWGTPTGEYSSGFAEEFALAQENEIDALLYFRRVPEMMLADPGDQLKQVLAFRTEREKQRDFLYQFYEDDAEWEELVFRHLCNWLDNLREIEPPPTITDREEAERIQALEEALKKTQDAQVQAALKMVEKAWKAANNGLLTEAETRFACAVEVVEAPHVLNEYGVFLKRLGWFERAEKRFKQVIAWGEQAEDASWVAIGSGNLSSVYLARGDLAEAESMFRQALSLHELVGSREGMAIQYGNLGIVSLIRGDLKEAESMFGQALSLNQELGRKEGMASAYGNLGNMYRARDDLKKAESMYLHSLILYKSLGLKEGMAIQYGNLAVVYEKCGDLVRAESLYRQALSLHESIGSREGMAIQYGNLGVLYLECGDLEEAESRFGQALSLNQELGRREGMAYNQMNLGTLRAKQGRISQARDYWQQALKLFTQLGSPNAAAVQGWLDELAENDEA